MTADDTEDVNSLSITMSLRLQSAVSRFSFKAMERVKKNHKQENFMLHFS